MPSSGFDWFEGFRAGLNEHRKERASLPRYEAMEKLGEGGMAVVYRGWDVELGRPVAMKVLREMPGLTQVVRQRFEREARVTGSLSHPNILTLYDVIDTGTNFTLVMELVEGPPLSTILGERKLEMRSLFQLIQKAAKGVAAAHEMGIVHRDLKPANILVTPAGEPKVGDFGLAFVAGAETELTKTGSPMGTAMYMAPEQVRGTKDITGRTDVYALGGILYEIATGRPPHTGESMAEVFDKILHQEPIAPRKLNPKVSRDLETIILKSLEKDSLKRYVSAKEFAEDLGRALAGEPILARAPGPIARGMRWARQHRAAMLGLGAVILCVATAGTVLSVKALRNWRERNLTVQEALEKRAAGDWESEERLWLLAETLGDKTAGRMASEAAQRARSAQAQEKARDLAAQAKRDEEEYDRLRKCETEILLNLKKEEKRLKSFENIEKYKGFYELQGKAKAIRQTLLRLEASIDQFYSSALQHSPRDPVIAQSLVDFRLARMSEAKDAGNLDRVLLLEESVRRLAVDCKLEKTLLWLESGGTLSLDSNPPGAEVELLKYEEGPDRRLIAKHVDYLGRSLVSRKLDRGSYLLILHLPGYRDVRYPVLIDRQTVHQNKVKLYTEEEIGKDFVYVPGGKFVMGGDPLAPDSGPLNSSKDVGDFFISKFEVTTREYLRFITDLIDQRKRDEAQRRVPRALKDGDYAWIINRDTGKIRLPQRWEQEMDWPIFGVSWDDAREYCEWKSRQARSENSGAVYRLPTSVEWEKAGRGVDGRAFPWGNSLHWTFMKGAYSRDGKSSPEAVGSFPADESPYGVRDLAGSVSEWCDDEWGRLSGFKCARGGNWFLVNPADFRLADENGYMPTSVDEGLGFRIVRVIPPKK